MSIIRTQSEIVSSGLDLHTATQLIADRSRELTGATAAVFETAEGDDMVYKVTSGEATPYLGMRLPQSSSLSGLCVVEDQILWSDDTSEDPRVDGEACRRVNAASMICVPLSHHGQAVGVLKVYANIPNAFSDADVQTLELLTEAIAAHVSHSTQFELVAHDSNHDALTGMLNRRAYQTRLAVEITRTARTGRTMSVGLMDLDGFKSVNDALGHPAGDQVLKRIAEILDSSRVSDDWFRIGGDEFAVLMPDTDAPDAKIAMERIIGNINEADLGQGMVGVSFGIASASGGDPEIVHAEADRELVAAKNRLYADTASARRGP